MPEVGTYSFKKKGSQPFAHIRPGQALLALRELLAELGVQHADDYRAHDFRRDHAAELRRAGGRLGEYWMQATGDL